MYARSTNFPVRPDSIDAGTVHICHQVLPALETMPGFIGLSLLVDRQSEHCILTTAWDSDNAMQASAEAVRPIRDGTAEAFGGTSTEPTVADWHILAVHRIHRARPGAWVRSTWLKLEPERFNQALEFCKTSVLPAIEEELDGFCSATVMADAASRRAVISAAYDTAADLDRNREKARSLRTARLRDLGVDQIDVGEFELSIAQLRVPEMV